jgi:membrane protein YqaA with SNARE-associated domain
MSENSNDNKEKPFIRKYGGLIFIGVIIALFVFLAVSGINFGQWLANTAMGFYTEFGDPGIYIGIFVISIFGNFTVIFPVPYTIALIVISVIVPGVNPIFLGLVAAAGACIGELSAWLIGRGSKEMLKDSDSINRMKEYVDRGWAPYLIFLFAATPLPDDAFLIVLGIAQYSIWKTLIFCFLGKFVLCFISSAVPLYLAGTPVGDLFLGLFGISIDAARTGKIPASTPLDMIRSTTIWIVTIVAVFLLVYVDWSKVFGKTEEVEDKIKEIKEIDKHSKLV